MITGRDALYTCDTELAFKRPVMSSVMGSRLFGAVLLFTVKYSYFCIIIVSKGVIYMADVLQLAKCILDKQGEMTTMKLQKLCYYCQAWSLAWDETPLIDEEFEAWANGPVCPELYNAHKGLFAVNANYFNANYSDAFNQNQLDTIDRVLKYYGDKEPHWLSELTHLENPWKLARIGYAPGERCSEIITKESMQEYYGGLQ